MHHDTPLPTSGSPLFNLFQWLAGNGYAPHRGCFLGDTRWVTAYVAANWVVALAYTLIALLIAQRMKRAAHIPRTLMGNALLGIFVTCSVGHFLEGFTTLLWPGYRLETIWHWLTAIPAWLFLANHNKFSLIVEGPHMIAETRQELSRKNEELNTLYEQVKEVDKLKSAFFANVSHELRTPLALILGPLQKVLAADNLTSSQRSDLEVVARNARTVLKHVNDLLDISRMEADRMKMRYIETDLAQLVRVMASHFDRVVAEREQTFLLETPSKLLAQVDADKMQRILLNLFSNAIKFVQTGGTIICRLRYEGSEALIEVQDNGPGIPAALRRAVFDRFRQVDDTASRAYEGTGLGLSIVKDFVELHGGSVSVTEAPGGGALFHIRFPLFAPAGIEVAPDTTQSAAGQGPLKETREASETAASSTTSDTSPSSTSSSVEMLAGNTELAVVQTIEELRTHAYTREIVQESELPVILVVEDNREMSQFILQTLAPAYRVFTAYDGAAGVKRALELRPDLILSDIMMPIMSGDQMVEKIRSRPELAIIPIILLTARADDELRIRLLQQGAQDYLTKPFAPEELRARVYNLVSSKRARQALQEEFTNQQEELTNRRESLEELAKESIARKKALQMALADARAARESAEEAREEAVTLQHALENRNSQLNAAVQEAHHRIKNNLQVLSALLELQIFDRDTALPLVAVQTHLRHIKAIALIHNLMTPSSGYNEVDAAEVLKQLARLFDMAMAGKAGKISILLKAETLIVPIKVATSLTLIVNELLDYIVRHSKVSANSLSEPATSTSFEEEDAEAEKEAVENKVAYQKIFRNQELFEGPDAGDVIFIKLGHNRARAALSIEYPGPGFPADFDVLKDGGDNLELVLSLVENDLQGHIHFGSTDEIKDGIEPDERDNSEISNQSGRGRIEIDFPERPESA